MSKVSELIFGGAPHRVTSPYGPRGSGFHYGCDYGTYLKNAPQYAIEAGEVLGTGCEANAAGYYIWVKYPRIGKRFLHCHLQKPAALKKGDKIQRGTLLGYTGSSGNSTGIHLHLGVRDLTTDRYEDPEVFAMTYTDPITAKPLCADSVRMQMGFASAGDVKRIGALLEEKQIPFAEADGVLVTDIAVSCGDQAALVQLCTELGVPCAVYGEGQTAADTTREQTKMQLAALLSQAAELLERM